MYRDNLLIGKNMCHQIKKKLGCHELDIPTYIMLILSIKL